jgi:hypothetical protein
MPCGRATLAYFTLANPGMKMGGFSAYSKYDILRQLQKKYLPKQFSSIIFPPHKKFFLPWELKAFLFHHFKTR